MPEARTERSEIAPVPQRKETYLNGGLAGQAFQLDLLGLRLGPLTHQLWDPEQVTQPLRIHAERLLRCTPSA